MRPGAKARSIFQVLHEEVDGLRGPAAGDSASNLAELVQIRQAREEDSD